MSFWGKAFRPFLVQYLLHPHREKLAIRVAETFGFCWRSQENVTCQIYGVELWITSVRLSR